MDKTPIFFLYCPKLVMFSKDWKSIFLARRKDEADYDGTFAFIGGKLETTDASIEAGMRREKNEEIGSGARVRAYLDTAYPILFHKKDGSSMIVPHHLAQFAGGEIQLNPGEYSEYKWVALEELENFEPKIKNIPSIAAWALALQATLKPQDFVEI